MKHARLRHSRADGAACAFTVISAGRGHLYRLVQRPPRPTRSASRRSRCAGHTLARCVAVTTHGRYNAQITVHCATPFRRVTHQPGPRSHRAHRRAACKPHCEPDFRVDHRPTRWEPLTWDSVNPICLRLIRRSS